MMTLRMRPHFAATALITLFFLAQPADAQDKCRKVNASLNEVHPAGAQTFGVSTNAGIFNGTTFREFDGGPIETPIPTTWSVTSHWTLTTRRGELRTRNVYIYDILTGRWTALGHIDPSTSTGRFAGATGVLYFNGRTAPPYPTDPNPPFTYLSDLTGKVCFARTDDDREDDR
jgi:hypothetical protein